MERYFLGIDQGTTGTTALLLNHRWEVAAVKTVEHAQIYPKPGWVEHDPEEIWNAIQTAAFGVLQAAGVSPSQVVSIGIDNQGETCMVWNRRTGRPVCNAIVWQDRRTAEYADVLKETYGRMIKERTGLGPDAYFSATKLKWILDNVEGVRDMIDKGEILAGTLDAYIIWRFTGGRAFVTDPSTASRTMMMDLKTAEWDQELLDIYGIPREILPEIHDSVEIYGYTTSETFFGERKPVAASLTDALAALLAQGCLDAGDIKTSYGTGCFMYTNLGNTIRYSDNLITVCSWRIGGKINYAFDGGVYIAGAAVQWLRDKIRLIGNAAETEMISQSVPDTGGVYFVPAFAGLAAPYWDQYARGAIVGITGGTTSAHIVRATLESIAFQVYDNAMAMREASGYGFSAMKVDGGPVANRFLMQFQADILAAPVDVPVVMEMTPFGAAWAAALAVGEFSGIQDIRSVWKLQRRYEPRMSDGEREDRLEQWHRAVERARGWIIPDREKRRG